MDMLLLLLNDEGNNVVAEGLTMIQHRGTDGKGDAMQH